MVIRYLLLFPLFLTTLYACSRSDDVEPEEETADITVDVEGSSTDFFSEGDRIGIYPVAYLDGNPGTLGDIANPMNIGYMRNRARWEAENGNDVFLDNVRMDFYAYYPYDPELSRVAGKLNTGAYPFDVSGDQGTLKKDFLWAKTERQATDPGNVHFIFTHVLTRLIINLDYDTRQDDARLAIHNTVTSGTINLRNGGVMVSSAKGVILPALLPVAENGYDYSFEAILMPQEVDADTPFFYHLV